MINTNNKIAIVGAGLCGSTLAILLQKKGYDVTVYEKQTREHIFGDEGKRSINLFLSKRAEIALTEAGVWGRIEQECVRVRGRYYHVKNGHPVSEKDGPVQPYSNNPEETNYSIKRSILNMILIEEAEGRGIGINFDTGIDKDVLDRLKSEYSAVICASGLGFDINTALWRSTGKVENCRQNEYEFEYFETAIPNNLLEKTFPYKSADDIARGTDYLHIWSFAENFMIIALPNQDHSHNCIVFFKERRLPAGENYSELDFKNWSDFIRERTAGDPTFAGAFTGICEQQPAKISKLMDLRCENWVGDNLLMIGDCSHAVLPFHGQGANAAMEDANILYKRLPDVNTPGPTFDWTKEFYGFFEDRRKDAYALLELAREYHYSLIGDARDPDEGKLLLGLSKSLESVLGLSKNPESVGFETEYHMVTFNDTPYPEALARYETEKKIFADLKKVGALREKVLNKEELNKSELDALKELVKKHLSIEKRLLLLERIEKQYQFDDRADVEMLLEGLADPKTQGIVYWDYIEVDTLLSLQKPRTSYPDEIVFIIYHQIHELYFKLIIQELKNITEPQENPDRGVEETWKRSLKRCIRYMYKLIGSFDVLLHGLLKKEFMAFRNSLLPASGFQTHQFRLIEIMLTSFECLVSSEIEKRDNLTLHEHFEHIYWRRGAINQNSGKPAKLLINFNVKYDDTFRDALNSLLNTNVYSRYIKADPGFQLRLRELMRDLEESILMWKIAHFNTITTKIGTDQKGTGGTKWDNYLRVKNQKIHYFPEIWPENTIFDTEIERMKKELPGKIIRETEMIMSQVELPEDGKK